MTISVNDKPAMSGRVTMPRYGAWHATFMVDTDAVADVTGACSIAIEGGATLTGTSYRVGDFEGRVSVWIVGGAAKLPTALVGKFYDAAPVRTILADIATESGEAIAATADVATLATLLPRWMRCAGTAGRCLATLTTVLGVPWRMLDDGTIWVGPESYAAYTGEYDLMDTDPVCDRITIADETCGLRPGMTIEGRNVSYVEHVLTDETIRTEAYLA